MNEDELSAQLMKLAKSGTERFVTVLERLGVTFEGIERIGIARKLVESKFGFTEAQFLAVDFVFWISYATERDTKELIVFPEIEAGIRPEFLDFVYSLLSRWQREELTNHFEKTKDTQLDLSQRKLSLEFIVDTLTLGNKIQIIEKFYAQQADTMYLLLLKDIHKLRNDISHARVENLMYKSCSLLSGKGQLLLFTDMMNSLTRK